MVNDEFMILTSHSVTNISRSVSPLNDWKNLKSWKQKIRENPNFSISKQRHKKLLTTGNKFYKFRRSRRTIFALKRYRDEDNRRARKFMKIIYPANFPNRWISRTLLLSSSSKPANCSCPHEQHTVLYLDRFNGNL